jgi:hypothetical protein
MGSFVVELIESAKVPIARREGTDRPWCGDGPLLILLRSGTVATRGLRGQEAHAVAPSRCLPQPLDVRVGEWVAIMGPSGMTWLGRAMSGGWFPLALGVQILALDVGTDTLSAVVLGAEPPAPHALGRPPVSGRLLNRTVLRRASTVLGPTEALVSLVAFVPCSSRPGGDREIRSPVATAAAASGAAFMTGVIAQVANAFACRSSTRWRGSSAGRRTA